MKKFLMLPLLFLMACSDTDLKVGECFLEKDTEGNFMLWRVEKILKYGYDLKSYNTENSVLGDAYITRRMVKDGLSTKDIEQIDCSFFEKLEEDNK